MIHRIGLRLTVIVAVVLVAVASMVSVVRIGAITPDPIGMAEFIAIGGELADICGEPETAHSDHCPYCRLLSEPPNVVSGLHMIDVQPSFVWLPRASLVSLSLCGNTNIYARGPPTLI